MGKIRIVILILFASSVALAGSLPGAAREGPDGQSEVPPTPKQLAALDELERRVGGQLRADFNPRNGAPSSLVARGSFLSGPSSDSPRTIARNFLLDNAELLAVSPGFVAGLTESRTFRNDNSGVTHIWHEQHYQGLKVFQSTVRIAVTADGKVLTFAGNYYPELSLPSTDPVLTEGQAMEAAYGEVGPPVDLPPLSADDNPAMASARDLFVPTAELVVFPLPEKSAVLAWRVEVPQAVSFWDVVVDANDGAILHVDNRTKDHEEGQVFLEHPDAGPISNVPFGGKLPAPRDTWVGANIFVPNDTCTSGNNAIVIEDRDTDGNGFLACDDPDLHFKFGFADSYALTGNPDADEATSTTNLFYLINVSHDYFYQLGFTEAAGNFQSDNYGAGGLAGDPVIATTYTGWDVCTIDQPDFDCRNNAWFVTRDEGTPSIMQTFLFTSPPVARRDPSLDGDVIIHEYGHGVSNRLVPPGGLSGIQSGAMGEGWSDYFAISFYNDPVSGEYTTQNPTTGIRRYAYDNSPLTYGDLCGGPFGCEVHDDGEIWGVALWDLRAFYISRLGLPAGSAAADELVVEALMLTPPSPSMLNARDAILAAELAMPGDYQSDVWQVFANRGMGCSATSAGDSGSVTEAFDGPPCAPPSDNNNFADAILISPPLPYSNKQDTTGASAEAQEPIPPGGQDCFTTMDTTVWYRYTPGSSQTLVADTFGSNFDTQIIVWSGTDIKNLTFVGCNDDADAVLQSEVTFGASGGTTYYFQLDGYGVATGNLVFNLAWAGVAPGDKDSDGCTDAQEAGGNEALGGRRDPNSFWDFFDTPNASNVRDQVIDIGDIFRVVDRFGSNGDALINPLSPPPTSGYHTAFDRSPPTPGGDAWDLNGPDGVIDIGDIFASVNQFGHSCV